MTIKTRILVGCGAAVFLGLVVGNWWETQPESAANGFGDRNLLPEPESLSKGGSDFSRPEKPHSAPGIERSEEISARWHPNNAELARPQYEVTSAGEVRFLQKQPEDLVKMFRFSSGQELSITYRSLDEARAIPGAVAIDDFEMRDFDELLALMAEGDWQVLDWAEKALAFCSDRRNRQGTNNCSGYNDEMQGQLQDMKEYLYDNGDVSARARKARQLRETGDTADREAARLIYRELWDNGYISGLNGLRETSPPIGDLGYEQQVEEVSYMFIEFTLARAYLDGIPSTSARRALDGFDDQYDQMMFGVHDFVREAAEARANEILARNAECCFLSLPDGW